MGSGQSEVARGWSRPWRRVWTGAREWGRGDQILGRRPSTWLMWGRHGCCRGHPVVVLFIQEEFADRRAGLREMMSPVWTCWFEMPLEVGHLGRDF